MNVLGGPRPELAAEHVTARDPRGRALLRAVGGLLDRGRELLVAGGAGDRPIAELAPAVETPEHPRNPERITNATHLATRRPGRGVQRVLKASRQSSCDSPSIVKRHS